MTDVRDDVLVETLRFAVPLHIVELRHMLPEQRQGIAQKASAVIAAHGDVLMFGGKKGAAGDAFNSLAKGLAAAAYAPGGVTFAGLHWCTDHAACEGASAATVTELQPKPPQPRRPIVDLELPA